MKQCPNPDCQQSLGEMVAVCPSCGARLTQSPDSVDEYQLLETIRETPTCLFYRARKKEGDQDVLFRLYNKDADFSSEKAGQVDRELLEVSALSSEFMVQHIALRQSESGQWYRVSEWLDSVSWGDLMGSRFFRDPRNKRDWIDLFIQMAEALDVLHKSGRILPHLTLDDLVLFKDAEGRWKVKLDYKLASAAADLNEAPQAVKELMEQHPDMRLKRPLDQRSDIWTLGHLMLGLLVGTDDLGDSQKMIDRIYHDFEPIVLHRKLSGLLRAMVEDDPNKRTTSMSKVVAALQSITMKDIKKWNKFEEDPTKKKKLGRKIRNYVLSAACVLILVFGSVLFYQKRDAKRDLDIRIEEIVKEITKDQEVKLDAAMAENLAKTLASLKGMMPEERIKTLTEKYRRSVAFVLTEIYLRVDGEEELIGHGTGTAFLVSSDGYLLTNRHVVCPWLGEKDMQASFAILEFLGRKPKFVCKLYLWFDGDPAFRKLRIGAGNPEDIYKLSNAYSSNGKGGKRVELMGVMQEPEALAEKIYGLQNDAAVLLVDSVPKDAVPIPLASPEESKHISKGMSVFALGFPYGNKTIMSEKAISRFTEGTITRVFENVLATDADLHPGNSGGPVIDLNGYVIGLATAIFSKIELSDENDQKERKVTKRLESSIGRVLPIEFAQRILDSVRKGNPQWKGMPDYSFQSDVDKARKTSLEGNRALSHKIMEDLITQSPHPELYFWAGILCAKGDNLTAEGSEYMKKTLVMQPKNAWAQFLLYRADLLKGIPAEKRAYGDELAVLDWRSFQEFFGYLKKILDENVSVEQALGTGDTPVEEAFIHWTAASLEKGKGNDVERVRHLQESWELVDEDSDLGFMIQMEMKNAGVTPEQKGDDAEETAAQMETILEIVKEAGLTDDQLEPIEQLKDVLKRMREEGMTGRGVELIEGLIRRIEKQQESTARTRLLENAFEYVVEGDWSASLEKVDEYLVLPQRKSSANSLRMELWKCQLLYLVGQKEEGSEALKSFAGQVKDAWYRRLAAMLLGEVSPDELRKEALNSPEKTLTLETALGLQGESEGDKKAAVESYNNALDSCLADWKEFSIALARRNKIRGESDSAQAPEDAK